MKPKQFTAVCAAAACALALCSCADAGSYGTGFGTAYGSGTQSEPGRELAGTTIGDDTWTIAWYMCGSDLESNSAAATTDLQEMYQVDLPDNVQVVIEAGGARDWHFDADPGVLNRYLFNSEGLYHLGDIQNASMGKADTLSDFLSFCEENYPADHTMVLFWDHGGGSVTGAEFDELYNYDSLTLDEFHQAFDSVYDLDKNNPPVDVVGFDTCLMATVDTVAAFQDTAQYLIASQETEPGCGWNYTSWLAALAQNPDMDPTELGQEICDSYQKTCNSYRQGDAVTLSVTDLSKAGPLLEAYDQVGQEALSYSLKDPRFFDRLSRAASRSDNYTNSASSGYTNMVDLGDLMLNATSLVPKKAQAVLDALDDAVVYQVKGPYHASANGLSCYHSYNGDVNNLKAYKTVGASPAFTQLYNYVLTGDVDEDTITYLYSGQNSHSSASQSQSAPDYQTPGSSWSNSWNWNDISWDSLAGYTSEIAELSNHELTTDSNGSSTLTLGDAADSIANVYLTLGWFDPGSNAFVLLGKDNNVQSDWNKGVFKDNFAGTWGSIDNHLAYMDLYYEGDDYNLYEVPILLNDNQCSLMVAYDYNSNQYQILGARENVSSEGAADKNLTPLKTGDTITTLLQVSTMDEDDDLDWVEGDSFKVKKNTSFKEGHLPDGQYVMFFEMVDAQNNAVFSAPVVFTVDGEDIYTQTDLDQ